MELKLDRHMCKFDVKTIDEAGVFEGYGSVSGNIDKGKDVMLRGAFTKTLQEQSSFPLYWMHEHIFDKKAFPIGAASCIEDGHGLKVQGRLNMESPRVREEIYPLMKLGVVKTMSIGYKPVQQEMKTGGIRHLKEVKLGEVTLAVQGFEMNPLAVVTGVKTMDLNEYLNLKADFATTLAAALAKEDLRRLKWRLQDAMGQVLSDVMASAEMTDAQKIAAITVSLDQYKALMLDWVSRTLAMNAAAVASSDVTVTEVMTGDFDRNALKTAHEVLSALIGAEPGKPTQADDEPQGDTKTMSDAERLLAELKSLNL